MFVFLSHSTTYCSSNPIHPLPSTCLCFYHIPPPTALPILFIPYPLHVCVFITFHHLLLFQSYSSPTLYMFVFLSHSTTYCSSNPIHPLPSTCLCFYHIPP